MWKFVRLFFVVQVFFGFAGMALAQPMYLLPGSQLTIYLGGTQNDQDERNWGHIPITFEGVEVSSVTLPLNIGMTIDVGVSGGVVTALNIPAGLLSLSNQNVFTVQSLTPSSSSFYSHFAVANVSNLSGALANGASSRYSLSPQSALLDHLSVSSGFGGPIPLSGSIQFGSVNVMLGTSSSSNLKGMSWRTGTVGARVGFWDTAGGALLWPDAEYATGSAPYVKYFSSGTPPTPIDFVSVTLVQPTLFLANQVTQLNSFGELTLILSPTPVPEPSGLALVSLGILGLLIYRRRW